MSELALKRIAANKNTKAKFLDLRDCGIIVLPNELRDCIWIEQIWLTANKDLSDLFSLSFLVNLRTVDWGLFN